MKYKKIFIASPVGVKTGGPETLHQMCEKINNNGGDASMVYFTIDGKLSGSVDVIYDKYNVKVAPDVENDENNLFIVPETYAFLLQRYHRVNKMICWLSLAYFTQFDSRYVARAKYSKFIRVVKPLTFLFFVAKYPKLYFATRQPSFKVIATYMNSYNTLEEKRFLEKKGVKTSNYLCGPIADEYFDTKKLCEKKNIISYNPKKGYKFTKKVIDTFKERYGDEFTFLPIENMTSLQVVEALDSSVLYIDFGYFPGHERIPRQACLRYANIIVSKNGSAAFKDIACPEQYKFATINKNVNKIVETMYELASNYQEHIKEFDYYREFSKWQRENFENEINSICDGQEFDIEKEFFDKK